MLRAQGIELLTHLIVPSARGSLRERCQLLAVSRQRRRANGKPALVQVPSEVLKRLRRVATAVQQQHGWRIISGKIDRRRADDEAIGADCPSTRLASFEESGVRRETDRD